MAVEHGLGGFENGTMAEFSTSAGSGTATLNTVADGTARSGSYQLRVAPSTSQQRWAAFPAGTIVGTSGTVTSGNHKRLRLRAYIRINAFPSGSNPNEERIFGSGSFNGTAVMWIRAVDSKFGLSLGGGAVTWSSAALSVGVWYRVILDIDLNVSANTTRTVSLQVTSDVAASPTIDETIPLVDNIGAGVDTLDVIMFGDSGGDHASAYSIDYDDVVWIGASDADGVSTQSLPNATKILPVLVRGWKQDQWETGTTDDVNEIPVNGATSISSVLGAGTTVKFVHTLASALGALKIAGLKVYANIKVVSASGDVDVVVNGVTSTKTYGASLPIGSALIAYMDWHLTTLMTATAFNTGTFDVTKRNGTQQTFIVGLSAEALVPLGRVTSVNPSSGTYLGGTAVTLTGVGFQGTTSAIFGAAPATSFVLVSDTSITCVTPPHSSGAGVVDVTVD